MELYSTAVGPVSTNCYFVVNPESREAVIIDPGDWADRLKTMAAAHALRVQAILLTHGHFDHIGAADELAAYYDVKRYAGEQEKEWVQAAKGGGFFSHYPVHPDVYLQDQAELHLAGFKFKVFHTPGHTRGSLCFYLEQEAVLFSGDTLFREEIGRTDLAGGSHAGILRSIRDTLYGLPDETAVYPGHGEATTIGHEKKKNPYIRGSS